MFEQDYLMRLIKEMVRAILKLLFKIDTDSPTADLLKDEAQKETLAELLKQVDEGNINEAENQVYEMTAEGDLTNLQIALIFYSYLNDKPDGFLQAHDFSREEVKSGLESVVSGYGLDSMSDAFLEGYDF